MQMNYELEMQPALVGGLGDLVFKTTDSYLAEEDMCPGMAVEYGTNAANQVKIYGEGDFCGVAMHSHKELAHPYYAAGRCVPVVTQGRVWVKVEGEISAKDVLVYFNKATNAWSEVNAEGCVKVPNVKFRTKAIQGMAMLEIC